MPESRLSIERAASGWPALREVLARSRTCGDSLRGVAKKPDLRHITATELHPLVVGLDTIGLDPENERAHPRANLDRIKYSLRRFGVRGALSLRAGELVTKGNGTLQALRELAEERATGLWDGAPKGKLAWAHVPVLEFDDSPAAAAEYRVLDNRSGENAGWERGALEASFETFPDVDWSQAWTTAELAAEFEGWGADDEKPSGDGGGGGGGGPSEDEEPPIPEPPAEPITQFGDVIQIGPHTLHCADCMEVMRAMPDNSVDFIGTDPPYGLSPDGKARTWDDIEALRAEGKSGPNKGFMGKVWDAGVPGITWARECLRVLKPGGFLVAFSATRTYHRLGCAVEDAGFEIRDMLDWLQWQGFPKSLAVGAAIDEMLGVEREVVIGESPWNSRKPNGSGGVSSVGLNETPGAPDITAPASDLAAIWEGFGTALKPAKEPAVVARKPLDAIAPEEAADLLGQDHAWSNKAATPTAPEPGDTEAMTKKRKAAAKRWGEVPEGAIEWRARPLRPDVEGRLELRVDGEVVATREGAKFSKAKLCTVALNVLKWGTGAINIDAGRFADGDPAWPGPDGNAWKSGGTSRWPANIYACPKPATSERNAGTEDLPQLEKAQLAGAMDPNDPVSERFRSKPMGNIHPTCKPRKLFVQLLALFCPPGGHVVEPFCGSGTMLVAAAGRDCRVTACELEPAYADISRARGEWALRPSEPAAPARRTPARDGDKRQARRRVQTLIDNGQLPKPEDVTCADCKAKPAREYDHHLGYAAEHHEDVVALCAVCHHARAKAPA